MRWKQINEIEVGGAVERGYLDDLKQEFAFEPAQMDMFQEIPGLIPDLPKRFEMVGRLGSYVIAIDHEESNKAGQVRFGYGNEQYKTYILFDKDKPFGFIYGKEVKPWWINGHGLQIKAVYIDRTHKGQNLSPQLYAWLLQNVCDYIMADEMQTRGGVYIWKKLLNSRRFSVFVHDEERNITRKRWAGKDFNQIYERDHYTPVVMLAGNEQRLLYDDEER